MQEEIEEIQLVLEELEHTKRERGGLYSFEQELKDELLEKLLLLSVEGE